MSVEVVRALEANQPEWDGFVASRPDAVGYHEWAWRRVTERTFGHEGVYLMARQQGRIDGVLPMVDVRSRLFGRSLTSLPFLNYAGVLATSDEVARALLNGAIKEAETRGAKHLELRHFARRFDQLPVKQHKVTMHLALSQNLWERLDRKVRNQVRKAEKSQLTAVTGGAELIDGFYRVFARNMRDLGTPVYARRFFEEVLAAFPERARLTVVLLGDTPVAASLSYRTGRTTEVPWASSIREYNHLCPNHLLYWRMIESAASAGGEIFDFGRSTPGEGTFKFKEQWGAVPIPLSWEYWVPRGGAVPDQSPRNPKFRMAVAVWKKLPLPVANLLGPHIVRSIP